MIKNILKGLVITIINNKDSYFYIAILFGLINNLHRFTQVIISVFKQVTQVLPQIHRTYPRALGLLLDDAHHSELERLDTFCATVGHNLRIFSQRH